MKMLRCARVICLLFVSNIVYEIVFHRQCKHNNMVSGNCAQIENFRENEKHDELNSVSM